ncbi:bacillithiol system redox-active protein YtxJ [Flavobacterium amniphilum]|uniref:bacillithiol system redox-active protein YtxJ n=1 Tax=Flavobacterium amniphilum TaxID=1834035 RepID=UPI00202A8435|nr:bacillithiol system redox-active protein YtxJ [Flavobacterium amniphilum]MCL9807551.1 bacillithiol system redox-active protein YtxJ [Flavobacterium amniphilum]
MSFFKSLFGSENESQNNSHKVNWVNLNHLDQLDMIVQKSWEKSVVIFKHSTRCSISRMALKQFENGFNLEGKIEPYFLDLLEYRPISNEIASVFGVMHQSPQILVIRNGVSVYNASHDAIQAESLHEFVK